MSKMREDPGPVPQRWLHCPRKANQLIMGKFMALKTPLDASYDSQVPSECRFHPKMFFDICEKKKVKYVDYEYDCDLLTININPDKVRFMDRLDQHVQVL